MDAYPGQRARADPEIDDRSHRPRRMVEGANDLRDQLVVERYQRAEGPVLFRRRDRKVRSEGHGKPLSSLQESSPNVSCPEMLLERVGPQTVRQPSTRRR